MSYCFGSVVVVPFRIFAAAFRSGVGRVPSVWSSLAFGVGVESIVREILRVAAQVAQHGAQVQNGFAIALAQVICATSFLVYQIQCYVRILGLLEIQIFA
jgi:hypothetical protein